MIVKTINQSWAIPNSMIERYGKNWATIDFEINPKLSNYLFRNDPLNINVGQICLCNKKLDASLKQLRSLKTMLEHTLVDIQLLHSDKSKEIEVIVLNKPFYLKSREITRLYETINDSIDTIQKSYKIGLYL
jgi:wobble nucleotide-excising tRNase